MTKLCVRIYIYMERNAKQSADGRGYYNGKHLTRLSAQLYLKVHVFESTSDHHSVNDIGDGELGHTANQQTITS